MSFFFFDRSLLFRGAFWKRGYRSLSSAAPSFTAMKPVTVPFSQKISGNSSYYMVFFFFRSAFLLSEKDLAPLSVSFS